MIVLISCALVSMVMSITLKEIENNKNLTHRELKNKKLYKFNKTI